MAVMRKKRGQSRQVFSLIKTILPEKSGLLPLALEWPHIVGADYARHSAPEKLFFAHPEQKTGGTLTIAVAASFAPFFDYEQTRFITNINRYFGYNAIGRLKLRHSAEFDDAEEEVPPEEALPEEAQKERASQPCPSTGDDKIDQTLQRLHRQLFSAPKAKDS